MERDPETYKSIQDLYDICVLRIILLFEDDVDDVCELINREFRYYLVAKIKPNFLIQTGLVTCRVISWLSFARIEKNWPTIQRMSHTRWRYKFDPSFSMLGQKLWPRQGLVMKRWMFQLQLGDNLVGWRVC